MKSPLYIDTLSPAEIRKIEDRLRPGQTSQSGFLGYGESLREVIYKDAETLSRLGVTHDQIADKLESLIQNPRGDPSLKVDIMAYRGMQDNPFQDGQISSPYSNLDIMVKNQQQGNFMGFPGLMIILVRDYQFFEGNVPYRLDPERAISFLGLK